MNNMIPESSKVSDFNLERLSHVIVADFKGKVRIVPSRHRPGVIIGELGYPQPVGISEDMAEHIATAVRIIAQKIQKGIKSCRRV